MASPPEIEALVAQQAEWRANTQRGISESLRSVQTVTLADLVRPDRDKRASFDDRLATLAACIHWRDLLMGATLDKIPSTSLGGILECADLIARSLKGVRDFSLDKHPTTWQDRKREVDGVIDNADHFLKGGAVAHLAAAVAAPNAAVAEALARAEQVTLDFVRMASEAQDSGFKDYSALREKLHDAEGLLEKVRERAQFVSIASEAQIFDNRATDYARGAKFWLKVAGGAAVLAFALGVVSAFPTIVGLDWPPAGDALPAAAGRLILFSAILTAAIWAGRVYRAHRHNEEVNRHRANALSTFQLFAESAKDDPETRSYILRQATTAIFSPQPTGFTSSEPDGPSTHLLEFLPIRGRDIGQ